MKLTFFNKSNEQGSALILSYLALSIVLSLTVAFTMTGVNELNQSKIYQQSTRAFWLAEAGLNQYMNNPNVFSSEDNVTFNYYGHSVVLSHSDTPSSRIVTSTANVDGIVRSVQAEFPANLSKVFLNTLNGREVIIEYSDWSWFEEGHHTFNVVGGINVTEDFAYFDHKGRDITPTINVDEINTISTEERILDYPDADENGTVNEFNDFVEYYRDVVNSMNPSEVQYIVTDGSEDIYITSESNIAGKKLIYVEGPTWGTPTVSIIFEEDFPANENVTIVSTGEVKNFGPVDFPESSQLNAIAMSYLKEYSQNYSNQRGILFSHDYMNIYRQYVDHHGILIANDALIFTPINDYPEDAVMTYTNENFDPLLQHRPAGFDFALSAGENGYSNIPLSWREI